MTCPLCGEHELSLTMFGGLFVAPCPEAPANGFMCFPGPGRPVVLESPSRNP